MEKERENTTSLINKAINVSFKFEALMDSIDFNSYLPEDEDQPDINNSLKYKTYSSRVEKAHNSCENIIEEIPEEIKNIKQSDVSQMKDENLAQYLIYRLFEAKKIRLEGRKQIKREDEVKKYIQAAHLLHEGFVSIPIDDFLEKVGNSIYKKHNWAKVLYYNELAICYSGLVKSSMSLGYAEESIYLLEILYPELKNLENPANDENPVDDNDNFNKLINELNGDYPSPSHIIIKLYTIQPTMRVPYRKKIHLR